MLFFCLSLSMITGDAWRAVYPDRDTRSPEQGLSKGLLRRERQHLWQRRALCVSSYFLSCILFSWNVKICGRNHHVISDIYFCCLQLARRQPGRLPVVSPSTSPGRPEWKVWRWQLAEQLVSWHEHASLWTRGVRGSGSWRKELLSWWPVQRPSPNTLMR